MQEFSFQATTNREKVAPGAKLCPTGESRDRLICTMACIELIAERGLGVSKQLRPTSTAETCRTRIDKTNMDIGIVRFSHCSLLFCA